MSEKRSQNEVFLFFIGGSCGQDHLQIKRGAVLLSFPSASKVSETRFSAGWVRSEKRKDDSLLLLT
jgi:hypothetical protein